MKVLTVQYSVCTTARQEPHTLSVFENDDCSFGNEADLQSHRRLSILGRLEKWGYVEQIMASDKKGSNGVLQKRMTDVGYIGIIGLRVGPRRREELSEQRELQYSTYPFSPRKALSMSAPLQHNSGGLLPGSLHLNLDSILV